MSFKGHQLCNIDNDWTLDVTNLTGYKVFKAEDGTVKNKTEAFKLVRQGELYSVVKYTVVPHKIITKAIRIADIYLKDIGKLGEL